MKSRTAVLVILFSLVACGICFSQTGSSIGRPAATKSTYGPVKEYDPKRDAAKDVAEAVKEAQRTNKNILLEIGGKWCVWCGYLDKFFEANPALMRYREENYIMVKINYSPENKNEALISKYGKVPGYPHFFVLDKDGKLLHSQDTSKLEEGRGYNQTSVANFLREWAPKTRAALE